jgi:YVTN family beta-propeller protein
MVMGRAWGRMWKAVALFAALALVAGCTGGRGRHQAVQAGTRPSTATGQAKQASATLVRMAGTIRSWRLDPGVRDQLLGQIGYVVSALEQGNRLGAQALSAAWASNAQALASAGVLPRPDGSQYQALAAEVDHQLPDSGVVQPFTQSGASKVPDACGSGGLTFLDFVRTATSGSLRGIPYAGFVLSGFLELLWPDKNNPQLQWDCLYDQVLKAIDKKIEEHTREALHKRIQGIRRVIDDYVNAAAGLSENSPESRWKEVGDDWRAAYDWLNGSEPEFRPTREPFAFLPEYVEFMTLFLATLRDGVLFGPKFGFSTEKVDGYKKKFKDELDAAKAWVEKQYPAGRAVAAADVKYRMEYKDTDFKSKGKEKAAPKIDEYNATADYDLFMTPATKHQAFNWPYLNPDRYPSGVVVPPDTRVIYSPAFGSGASSFTSVKGNTQEGRIGMPTGPITPYAVTTPENPLSRVTVWTDCTRRARRGRPQDVGPVCPSSPDQDWVRGWRLSYASSGNGALYGHTTGSERSFAVVPADGKTQITKVEGVVGLNEQNPVVDSVRFIRSNGEVAGAFGNTPTLHPGCCGEHRSRGLNENYTFALPDEILANVYSGGNFPGETTYHWSCDPRAQTISQNPCLLDTTWAAPSSIVFGFRLGDSYGPPPPPRQAPTAWVSGNPLSVVDTATNEVDERPDIGNTGAVAAAADGRRVYVAGASPEGSHKNIAVIDTTPPTRVADIIPLPGLSAGSNLAVAPDGKHLYVTEPGVQRNQSQTARVDGKLWVIDTAEDKVISPPIGIADANGVAVAPDGRHVYVTNSTAFKLMVIDTTGSDPAHYKVSAINLGSEPEGVAVAPDGHHVYVTSPGFPGKLWMIDTADNTVAPPVDVGNNPKGVAVAPDGHVYVANFASDTVSVIDTADNAVAKVKVGSHPYRVAVAPDGRHVYVTNQTAGTVSVIDTADNTVVKTIAVGKSPNGIAISSGS